MKVIITEHVLQTIDEWQESLKTNPKYDISVRRINEKNDNLLKALNQLGFMPGKNPVCRFRDMGQMFDKNNNPKNKDLRQYVYKDESEEPWTFAYMIDKKNNEVLITEMKLSRFVKESMSLYELYSVIFEAMRE